MHTRSSRLIALRCPVARLYFDHGSEGLDALYPPFQRTIDALCRGAGYREVRACVVSAWLCCCCETIRVACTHLLLLLLARCVQGVNFASRVFPGEGHDEAAWRRRLAEPLRFLFGVQ